MKKFIVAIIASVLFSGMAFAGGVKSETAFKGRVVETINGQEHPIQFACVYCEGTTVAAYTNENGEFALPIAKAGKYTLRFSHVGYKVIEQEVKIKKNDEGNEVELDRQVNMLSTL